MMRFRLQALLCLALCLQALGGGVRIWTDKDGRKIEATMLAANAQNSAPSRFGEIAEG